MTLTSIGDVGNSAPTVPISPVWSPQIPWTRFATQPHPPSPPSPLQRPRIPPKPYQPLASSRGSVPQLPPCCSPAMTQPPTPSFLTNYSAGCIGKPIPPITAAETPKSAKPQVEAEVGNAKSATRPKNTLPSSRRPQPSDNV